MKNGILKKMGAVALSLCMVATTFLLGGNIPTVRADGVVASVTTNGTTTNYTSIQDAFSAISDTDTSTIKLLADVTIASGENLSMNENAEYVKLDLNGHTFTVNGTLGGGKENADYPQFSPTVSVESETVGTFISTGTLNVSLCPWTADTYYIRSASSLPKYFGVDGGTINVSGGVVNGGMMINNGGDGDIEFNITGNACFSNMGDSRFVIYPPGSSATHSIHLTLNGGYYDEDPRLFYMADNGAGTLVPIHDNVSYTDVSELEDGYKYYKETSESVFTEVSKSDITNDDLSNNRIYFLYKDFVTVDESKIEIYSGQSDWAVDGSVYGYRVVGAAEDPDPTPDPDPDPDPVPTPTSTPTSSVEQSTSTVTETPTSTVVVTPSMTLGDTSLVLKKGKKASVSVTLENDTLASATSSNSKVATASISGNKVVVKAVKNGSAKVTVSSASGISATIKVKVQSQKATTTKIKVSKSSVTLAKKGKSVVVTATATPSKTSTGEKIKVSSSDKKIATAKINSSGEITIKAKKKGSCTITVKAGSVTKTIKVKVKK